MRLCLLSVLVWISMLGVIEGATNEQLIRRLYIDVIGLPPTIEELEWYVVYNPSNSYELAVNTLVETYNLDSDKKNYYMSSFYISKEPETILKDTLYIFVQYFSSCSANIKVHKKEVLISFIENCKQISSDPVDVFDYMANCLMSRTTTVSEANKLLKLFKTATEENAGYLLVLEEILNIEDCYKK